VVFGIIKMISTLHVPGLYEVGK